MKALDNDDFIAARIDTGYLDRMLASRVKKQGARMNGTGEKIAAIAAALVHCSSNGKVSANNSAHAAGRNAADTWKNFARREALRER